MSDKLLKEAFLSGIKILKKSELDYELVTTESIIKCQEHIEEKLNGDEFNSLSVLLDAYWAFVNDFSDFEIQDYDSNYKIAGEFYDLTSAVKQIALRDCVVHLGAEFGDDEITDNGLVFLTDDCLTCVDREDLSLRRLVNQFLDSNETGKEGLLQLKKLFQDQVDYIESKIQELNQ